MDDLNIDLLVKQPLDDQKMFIGMCVVNETNPQIQLISKDAEIFYERHRDFLLGIYSTTTIEESKKIERLLRETIEGNE